VSARCLPMTYSVTLETLLEGGAAQKIVTGRSVKAAFSVRQIRRLRQTSFPDDRPSRPPTPRSQLLLSRRNSAQRVTGHGACVDQEAVRVLGELGEASVRFRCEAAAPNRRDTPRLHFQPISSLPADVMRVGRACRLHPLVTIDDE
jgi:hypothetical protein